MTQRQCPISKFQILIVEILHEALPSLCAELLALNSATGTSTAGAAIEEHPFDVNACVADLSPLMPPTGRLVHKPHASGQVDFIHAYA